MADAPLGNVVGYLRSVAAPGEAQDQSDSLLLERYLIRRDEAALAVLISRHAALVWGVCRRMLHHVQDAEDAFQATFVVLLRKAGSIGKRAALPCWLHGVACRVARRARGAGRQPQGLSLPVADAGAPDPAQDAQAAELRQVLDEEIARLPDRLRLAVILCYLEGKTNDEAARQLACPRGTVATHLARARQRLRARLTRRGWAAPAAGLGALVAQDPAALQAAGGAGSLSPRVLALAERTVRAMFWTQVQWVAGVVLALTAVAAAAGWLFVGPTAAQAPTPPAKTAKPGGAAVPQPKDAGPKDDEAAVRAYVAELRAAVKQGNQTVYDVAIKPMFRKSVQWAARKGEDALVMELYQLYTGYPENAVPGGPALTWAAAHNDPETVEILLGRGLDVNAADAKGRTALHLAIPWGPHTFGLLLKQKPKVNVKTKAGETPLMVAARTPFADVVEQLLDKGAEVNARDAEERTALMYAAERGRLANARALLAHGANVQLKDKAGRTALALVQAPPLVNEAGGFLTEERARDLERRAAQDEKELRELLRRATGADR